MAIRSMDMTARQHMAKSIDVTPEMAYQLILRLRREQIEYIVAPYEADAQMAYLEKKGKVAAIITEDSDLLLFGCQRVLFKLDKDGYGQEVLLKDLGNVTDLNLYNLSFQQFRQLCILSGCDYLPSILGVGLKTAYKWIQEHRSIENVSECMCFI
jgi:exonuclease 1